ncbi:MAG: hypothetical protein O3A46_03745 [Candidatus Poribacteria bacterium]|nr:hypothetical protein [Candidatus Poribacteria bacterium]
MPESRTRYLVGLPRGKQRVFLSWRLLADDAPHEPFHVERLENSGWKRVTTEAITGGTCFEETAPSREPHAYRVVDGAGAPSESVNVDPRAEATCGALDVPLNPDDTFHALILGELENNGRMGYVLRTERHGTVWIVAYAHNGRHLWETDTRLPSVGGWDGSTLHVPFLCWDVNDDGRSEVVFPRFNGRYPTTSYDLAEPGERLVAVDGATGNVVWETEWPAVKSRVMMTVGHLLGIDRHAHIVVLDETYRDVTLTAIDGKTGETFWRVDQARPAGHNLDIADIDGDGVQEVICGGVCYNGDGTVRWEAEPFGHTDLSKPAKIDPTRDGLQIWYAVESNNTGVYLVDKNGKTIFKEHFHHAHYGWVARHTLSPGLHPHCAEDRRRESQQGMDEHFPIFLSDGTHWLNLTDWQRKNFVPVHWDASPIVNFIIRKENKRVVRLLESGEIEDVPGGKLPEGGLYERNLACMDILGDFRENIVTVDMERHRLIVLVNPTVTNVRGYSPSDDFEYRHDRSQLGSGYYIYLSPPETIVERPSVG